MTPSELISMFSKITKLPIDVNDIVKEIKSSGLQDNISFIGVDFNIDILQGQIKTFRYHAAPYSQPENCANIYYHKNHTQDWIRFICCKELIHLLDLEAAKIKSPDEIRKLAEKIGLPPEMQDPANDGIATNVDRIAEFRAIALLFPWDARQILMTPYKAETISIKDIARIVDIPSKYAGFVMHETWAVTHDILSK